MHLTSSNTTRLVTLSPSKLSLTDTNQISFAASLLGIFAMLGAKISIVLLYQRLAPQQASKGMLFLYATIAVWAVFAILAQSFQCGGSVIFTPEKCLSGSLQYPAIILNIITDALLSFWMAPRFWGLQGSTSSRLVPIILFGLRIFVCFVSVAKLIVYGFNVGKDDQTWAQVTPWVFNMYANPPSSLQTMVANPKSHSVVVHLSTFHATLPRINSLIVDFSTGQIDLRVAERDIELMDNSRSGGNSKDRSGTFKDLQNVKGSQNQDSQIRSPKLKEKVASPKKWRGERESTEELQTVCCGKRESDMGSRDFSGGDADETGSQSSLSRNAVYQTVEFRWEEEYKARKSKS